MKTKKFYAVVFGKDPNRDPETTTEGSVEIFETKQDLNNWLLDNGVDKTKDIESHLEGYGQLPDGRVVAIFAGQKIPLNFSVTI